MNMYGVPQDRAHCVLFHWVAILDTTMTCRQYAELFIPICTLHNGTERVTRALLWVKRHGEA
jgi:hypothetical protein